MDGGEEGESSLAAKDSGGGEEEVSGGEERAVEGEDFLRRWVVEKEGGRGEEAG